MDWILSTTIKQVQKQAQENSLDKFVLWYANKFILEKGNRETGKEILKHYNLTGKDSFKNLYNKLRM